MKYKNIIEAEFIERRNRFISLCKINNEIKEVYVPNTGRCAELFIKGSKVFLRVEDNPNRKTKFTLVNIYKDDLLINIDSSAPNKILEEALKLGKIAEEELTGFDLLVSEKTFGKSRFDFYLEKGKEKTFIEVKGVTLEKNGIAMFPDAPTLRGVKHLKELIEAKKLGYNSYIIFIIQMDRINKFIPNGEMHPEFRDALWEAKKAGVNVLAFNCNVLKDEVTLQDKCQVLEEVVIFRKAEIKDIPEILSIYDDAKKSLKSDGVDQWQDGYPNENTLIEDIKKGISYLIEKNGEVAATGVLDFSIEPTYKNIYEGNWLIENETYGTVHRLAVKEKEKQNKLGLKIMNEFIKITKEKGIRSIKIDTHEMNKKMNAFIKRLGFKYCGIIHLVENPEDKDLRLAYEMLI